MVKTKRKKFPRPKARKIPLELVTTFLKKKGYQVVKIERYWRHVTAVVERGKKQYFFKMATTIKTGKMTKNEYSWNERVRLQINSETPFLVPQNYDQGFYQDNLFFFISDYFGKETLADQFPPNPKQLNKWLSKVARTAFLISQIKIKDEPEKKPNERTIGEHLISSASEWAAQVEYNLQPLLTIIKKANQKAERRWRHGDFVPWHMYDLKKGKFGLVDAEHGGNGLRYYDAAYFYIRVRQSLGKEEWAKAFLSEFKNLLPKKEKPLFWRDLKPILAERLIGDYRGASIGPKAKREEKLKKCEQFKEDLVKNRII